jgi:hypothetical protein
MAFQTIQPTRRADTTEPGMALFLERGRALFHADDLHAVGANESASVCYDSDNMILGVCAGNSHEASYVPKGKDSRRLLPVARALRAMGIASNDLRGESRSLKVTASPDGKGKMLVIQL